MSIALEVRDLHRSFGENHVLRGVDIAISRGKISGLIGPSGSGKSVLLKALAGIDGEPVSFVNDSQPDPDSMSLMFQEGALFDSFSVFDNVAFPLVGGNVPVARLCQDTRETVSESVSDILRQVGLIDAAYKYPGQLSGGMRRRISMARALVSRPSVALLDDPTAGLDPVASSVIMRLVCEIQASIGSTVLMVSQDLRRLLPVCDEIFALDEGKIVFRGTLNDLRETGEQSLQEFVRCRFDLDSYLDGKG